MSATSAPDVTRDSRVTINVTHARSHAPVTESRPVPSSPDVSRGAIHACNPTRSYPQAAVIATAAATPDRHAWMAPSALSGGDR
jgi:hypothetical protein